MTTAKNSPQLDATRGAIVDWINGLRVGPSQHVHNLTLFPLFAEETGPCGTTLLHKALRERTARVEELDNDGDVNTLFVENLGGAPLLIPEGLLLMGAKQHRMVDCVVMVAAQTSVPLAVSCVEEGRWMHISEEFGTGAFATPAIRADKIAFRARMRRAARQPEDQWPLEFPEGERMRHAENPQRRVWSRVSEQLCRAKVDSRTASLADAYAGRRRDIERYRNGFVLPEGAVGAGFTRGEHFLGLDLFGRSEHVNDVWRGLLTSYAFESTLKGRETEPSPSTVVEKALQEITRALQVDSPANSEAEVWLRSRRLVGAGLARGGVVQHLSAFSRPYE